MHIWPEGQQKLRPKNSQNPPQTWAEGQYFPLMHEPERFL
jgi:hypothetical protein